MKEETKETIGGAIITVYFTLLIIGVVASGIWNTNRVEKIEKALAARENKIQNEEVSVPRLNEYKVWVQEYFPLHRHNGIGGKVRQ